MIKAFFVDFYGTVVHEDEEIVGQICAKIKVNSGTDALLDEIAAFWWQALAGLMDEHCGRRFLSQRETELLSLRKTLHHFHASFDENELCRPMFRHWQTSALFADAAHFLRQVKRPVYVLSNIDNHDIRAIIAYHRLHFAGVITSEDVRAYKPRPDLFRRALQLYRLRPDDVLHAGDSFSSDIIGAHRAGIRCAWVNRTHDPLPEYGPRPDWVIGGLDELLKLE
jgi:2-haloacid dehalogenase/putative hydrolase of the HAD superfamily